MLKNHRIICIIPSFNEQGKTKKVTDNMPLDVVDETLVVNDGSSDNTCQEIQESKKATVLHNEKRMGIGFAIRRGLEYALKNNYDIIVVMAGNGKDNPKEIPRLIEPIVERNYDYVQGSRYLPGGEYGKMPFHRTIVTRVYPLLVRLLYFKKITDGTNGFRAYKASILKDKRINLYQEWLRECLEYYLSIKVIQLKYKITEAPVSKFYPQGVKYNQYSKVKPARFIKRLKPLFFLRFGIKK